jgi:RimJ/RimL family protein N-acetyltransferase
MRFVPLTTQEQWDWIDQRCYPIRDQYTTGIVAYDNTGKIAAMFVCDSFSRDSCGVHLAIDNPAVIRRGFLNECLNYIFNTRGRSRVFGAVPADNTKALKFNTHIGFREVARIPDGYATGVDTVIMRMDADDNRWVTPAQNRKVA